MEIKGIIISRAGDEVFYIAHKGWEIHQYRVSQEYTVTRTDLESLIGEITDGRRIIAVESFAVEDQTGKVIGLAFPIDPNE